MKHILAIIGVAAFLLATVNTQAQVPVSQAVTISNGGTNSVIGGSTVTYRAGAVVKPVIDVSYQQNFGYQISFKHNGATTNAYTFGLDTSVDGTTWKTNATTVTVIGIAFSTTGTNVAVGSINNAGVPYYRLGELTSTNDSGIIATNVWFKYNARMLVP